MSWQKIADFRRPIKYCHTSTAPNSGGYGRCVGYPVRHDMPHDDISSPTPAGRPGRRSDGRTPLSRRDLMRTTGLLAGLSLAGLEAAGTAAAQDGVTIPDESAYIENPQVLAEKQLPSTAPLVPYEYTYFATAPDGPTATGPYEFGPFEARPTGSDEAWTVVDGTSDTNAVVGGDIDV